MTSLQRGFIGPEGHRQERWDWRAEPEPTREVYDRLWSKLVHHPDGWDIPGMFQGVPKCDRTLVDVVVVGWLVRVLLRTHVVAHRLILDDGRRGIPLVDRRAVEGRLKQGAQLSLCLRRPIELTPVEVVASHHRQYSTGAILEREKGTFDFGFLVEGCLGCPGFHVEGRDLDVDEIARPDQTLGGRVIRPLKPLGFYDGVVRA